MVPAPFFKLDSGHRKTCWLMRFICDDTITRLKERDTLMQASSSLLEVRDVSKCYGQGGLTKRKRTEAQHGVITQALSHISFSIAPGEFVGIMGPSGSGKSTLLNCIATIDEPTSGSIRVGATNLEALQGRALAAFRREELGFVFQDSNMLDTLTIQENIALPLSLAGVSAQEILKRTRTIATQLGIEKTLERFPYEVSGGQKQRAAAARAVIMRPSLILADEPTGALDSKSARELLTAFYSLKNSGATILMVTHDAATASWCDRIIFIRDGKLWGQMRRDERDRKEFHAAIVATVARLEEGE